jgi:hypothetical protein
MISNPSVLAPRYLLATVLLLILLPVRAAEYMSLNDQTPRLLTAGVTICTLVVLIAVGLYFLNSVFYPNRTLLVLDGKMNECSRDGESCQAMATINQKAAPGERVYFATYQHYWLRGDLLQCVSGHQENIPSNFSGDKSWLYLYQRGFTYLFIDEATHGDTLKQLDVQNPPAWLKLNVLYDDQGKLLVSQIKLLTPPSTSAPRTPQRKPASTLWEVISQ